MPVTSRDQWDGWLIEVQLDSGCLSCVYVSVNVSVCVSCMPLCVCLLSVYVCVSVCVSLLWSPYGIRQTIIFSSCGFFFLSSFFFLAESQPSQIGCLPYFRTWYGLSANLRCRSETCCMRLAENTRRKKSSKNRHLGTIA